MSTKGAELPKAYEYKMVVGDSLYQLGKLANEEFARGWHPDPNQIRHHAPGEAGMILRREVSPYTVGGNPADVESCSEVLRKSTEEYAAKQESRLSRSRELTKEYAKRFTDKPPLGLMSAAQSRSLDEVPPIRGGRPVDDDGHPLRDEPYGNGKFHP